MLSIKDLTGKTMSKFKQPSQIIGWAEAKTKIMIEHARIVVTLDENGTIANMDFRPEFMWTGNYLIVVGPVIIEGISLETMIRLEIGFGRSVPYQQFEWKVGKKSKAVKERYNIPLTDEESLRLLPIICSVITQVIDEKVTPRKELGYRMGTRQEFLTGAYVTIPNDHPLLVYSFLARNMENRRNTFHRSFAEKISRLLKGMRFANYSVKELRAHKGSREIADKLRAYTREQVESIGPFLGKQARSKNRHLFEEIINAFNVQLRKRKEPYEIQFEDLNAKYKKERNILLQLCTLPVATQPFRDTSRKFHAKNCLRVEIYPSKWLQQNHSQIKRESQEEMSIKDFNVIKF